MVFDVKKVYGCISEAGSAIYKAQRLDTGEGGRVVMANGRCGRFCPRESATRRETQSVSAECSRHLKILHQYLRSLLWLRFDFVTQVDFHR